ncbi:hypothetical protein [Priestia megaterium]
MNKHIIPTLGFIKLKDLRFKHISDFIIKS